MIYFTDDLLILNAAIIKTSELKNNSDDFVIQK